MDRTELADFLRRRRQQLVVSMLAGMSTDYYTRREQARGPQPSVQVLAALARALRFTEDERDHLYHLVGQPAPTRAGGGDKHVGPGLLHLLTKLDDTPACAISDLGRCSHRTGCT